MDENAMFRGEDEASLAREELAHELEMMSRRYARRAELVRSGKRDEPSLTTDTMIEVLAVRLARLEPSR
jgi:hypothetical protein